MALTEAATVREDQPVPPAPARRSLASRLSIGHVVMILAGLVAILLNLAFLRSNTETFSIAVARGPLPAGSVLSAGNVGTVEIGEAGGLAQSLLTEEAATALFGSVLARDVGPGEPIRQSDLRPPNTNLRLREYSIAVDPADAAGGDIHSADIVDIIAVIDHRAFYVAAGLEVIRVLGDDPGLNARDELVIVLSIEDRTALEIESARAAGSISVVRSTGAPPPVSGPVSVDPIDQP